MQGLFQRRGEGRLKKAKDTQTTKKKTGKRGKKKKTTKGGDVSLISDSDR